MSFFQVFGTALSAYGSLQKGAAQREQQRQIAAQREVEGEMLKQKADECYGCNQEAQRSRGA